jgi:hypothetical protein
LNDSRNSPENIVSSIQSSSHLYVAAIGELATKQALKLEGKHIAFAEVFSVDNTMLEKGMLDVSMLPNPVIAQKLSLDLSQAAVEIIDTEPRVQ